MKKISQIEKNDILEMHSKLKKPLISEQNEPSFIQSIIVI